MNIIKKSPAFIDWLNRIADIQAKARVRNRIRNAENSNFGDHHFLRDGVSEMRIDYGPGYRIYYAQEGAAVFLLLAGGDKRTQNRDIARAVSIWQAWKASKEQEEGK